MSEPELRYEQTGLWVAFRFPEDRLVTTTQETAQETTQETTQEKILALLRMQPSMTRKALATRIGISTDGVKYHLENLKSLGRIRHVGSTKAGHWEVVDRKIATTPPPSQ